MLELFKNSIETFKKMYLGCMGWGGDRVGSRVWGCEVQVRKGDAITASLKMVSPHTSQHPPMEHGTLELDQDQEYCP